MLLALTWVTLLCGLSGWADTQGILPFQQAEFSVFNALGSGTAVRQLVFALPDATWSSLTAGDPTLFVLPYALNTNFPSGGGIPFFCLVNRTWVPPAQPEMERDCPQPDNFLVTAHGNANASLAVVVRLVVMARDSIESELGSRILPLEGDPNITQYSTGSADVSFRATAGRFNGTNVILKAATVSGNSRNANNDPDYQEAWTGDLFAAINWGTDPLGNRQYLLMHFTMNAEASTDNPTCLPLKDVCQHFFGKDSVQPYFTPKWNAIVQQLSSASQFYLQGAIPELLFLYDFSGKNTVPPAKTVPPGLLEPTAVIPTPYQPYTNIFKFINQYDAGISFGLPIRYNQAGGNACGPTSLTMDINSQGYTANDVKVVYANTMEHGLTANNVANGFWPYRALYWLKGGTSPNNVAYVNPSPLPSGATVYSRWDTNRAQAAQGWAEVDLLLKNYKQPVVMRTDLGVGTAVGDGHFIVIFGAGHNDDLAKLYGPGHNGDYYIVGDPAGHFQINPSHHYGQVDYLLSNNEGANYGGWCAMYPKENLVNRITRNGIPEISAVTIGRASGPRARWTARSPVSLTVTDPYGNHSGIGTNGVVTSDIPQSFFEPAISEEEYGATTFFPDGVKSVEVDDVEGGTYQVDLIGTGTGAYHLDFEESDTTGASLATNTLSGTVVPGQRVTYTFNVLPTGPPTLHFSVPNHALVLQWPTNATGFSLQTTTNPASPNSWVSATNIVTVVGSLNGVTNTLQKPDRYFRLKK